VAYYYAVRGWLEVAPDKYEALLSALRGQIERRGVDDKSRLQLGGWCWNPKPLGFTAYVFYGADVTEEGLKLIEEVVAELSHAGLELCGFLRVTGEDGERGYEILIDEDRVERRGGSAPARDVTSPPDGIASPPR
jgi:hypothetical protein